jgi:hypothetical protein
MRSCSTHTNTHTHIPTQTQCHCSAHLPYGEERACAVIQYHVMGLSGCTLPAAQEHNNQNRTRSRQIGSESLALSNLWRAETRHWTPNQSLTYMIRTARLLHCTVEETCWLWPAKLSFSLQAWM